ncbi:ISAs1 family transposase, partial [Streptococcus sp. 121]|nr:ISAs1 family transposase [Streptococcus sp. 121]
GNFSTFSKRLIAIDGKTIKGNASAKQNPLHIVSAYATDLGVCFGQVATKEKSNEITAIPDLLDHLSIEGCMITIDAIGTQKEIAKKIIKQGGDFCLPVKENQKGLLEDIVACFSYDQESVVDYYETIEKAHGQIETRKYEVVYDTSWFRKDHPDWPHVQCLGKAICIIEKDDKVTRIERYFILSTKVLADELASYVRGHWKIESMHWLLDVVFREDANKTLTQIIHT